MTLFVSKRTCSCLHALCSIEVGAHSWALDMFSFTEELHQRLCFMTKLLFNSH